MEWTADGRVFHPVLRSKREGRLKRGIPRMMMSDLMLSFSGMVLRPVLPGVRVQDGRLSTQADLPPPLPPSTSPSSRISTAVPPSREPEQALVTLLCHLASSRTARRTNSS